MISKKQLILFFCLSAFLGFAQERIGNKWVDNNLTFDIVDDKIKLKGEFTFCILDTSKSTCIHNLSTGVEVKVYDQSGELIWEGIATGRKKGLKLPKALPNANYLVIKAFKPWVTNRVTGNLIHQSKAIEIKYYIQ